MQPIKSKPRNIVIKRRARKYNDEYNKENEERIIALGRYYSEVQKAIKMGRRGETMLAGDADEVIKSLNIARP